ncbi:MAG: hypothetical protein ACMUHY_00385 [Thermoplasmatota archaeon]
MSFTSGDRVLLHLLMKSSRADWSGGVADQDDIAAYCGIGRTHVPRALKPLISDGLVDESQGRAPGRTRRVKVYSLTPKGIMAATALRSRANETMMEWTDEKGSAHREPCVDALRRINDLLGSGSMSQIPISLFLTVGKERISWNEILFLSSSVRREGTESICLPEGFRPLPPPGIPDPFVARDDALRRLSSLIENNDVSALVGERGAGKRTLVSMLAETSGMECLWLTIGGDKEYCIEPSDYDVLVMVGAPIVDVTSTLIEGGEARLRDPRDGEWPDDLMELPLLGIMDGEMEVKGDAVLSLKGLEEAPFLEMARKAGLSEGLAREYFKASRGLPEALVFLQELEPSALSGLDTLDAEAALMSLMLGFRSRG